MKVPTYVKPIPYSFKGIPPGFAFLKTVFLRRDIYDDLKSPRPSPKSVGFLIHEQTHRRRMSNFEFVIYWFDPKLRFQEELMADKERFKYLKKNKVKFDFEKRAKDLSSIYYLWCTSYENAKAELMRVWREV